MRRKLAVALFAVVFLISGTAFAGTINFTITGGTTTPLANATVVDFNGFPQGNWGAVNISWGSKWINYEAESGAGIGIYVGDKPGAYRAPGPTGSNTTEYISVPSDGTGPSNAYDISFGNPSGYYYFGLYWGSIDQYNMISFYDSGHNLLGSFTGTDIYNAAGLTTGFGDANSNAYVNFFSSVPFFEIELSSTNYAFETDNHAFATPEPMSLALLGTGLLGIAGKLRRKK